MAKFDITRLNAAVDRLLIHTENSRHRFLLQAYSRHRYLEVAGRYEEIFAPDMMSPDAVYHFNANGNEVELKGQNEIKSLYRMWSETNQSIFFIESEEIAVADHYIASVTTSYQQVSGKTVRANKILSYLPKWLSHKLLMRSLASNRDSADNHDMYLYKSTVEMIWPYDDRGRLMGEDVWETEPSKAELIKLDPADVLSTQEAARQLNPLIQPLPMYPQSVSAADD
jgi:hypothetical protein